MSYYNLTNNVLMSQIGKRLELIRLQKKVKQSELSKSSTVSVSTIKRIESGKNFSMDALIKILRSLDHLGDLQALIAMPEKTPLEVASELPTKPRQRVRNKKYIVGNVVANQISEPTNNKPFNVYKKPNKEDT